MLGEEGGLETRELEADGTWRFMKKDTREGRIWNLLFALWIHRSQV